MTPVLLPAASPSATSVCVPLIELKYPQAAKENALLPLIPKLLPETADVGELPLHSNELNPIDALLTLPVVAVLGIRFVS